MTGGNSSVGVSALGCWPRFIFALIAVADRRQAASRVLNIRVLDPISSSGRALVR